MKSDIHKKKYGPLLKSFYIWSDHKFRNGFLYMPIRISSLQTFKVSPSLEEVQMFQQHCRLTGGAALDDILSDQDEWDILNDQTLALTVRDEDTLKQLDVGDRVEMVSGQYKGLRGQVSKKVDN